MKNTLETRLGIFFALALLAAIFLLEMVGPMDLFGKGQSVRARFKNIQELKVGDPVKMAGVQVGHVEKIDLAEEKVEVTLKLKKVSNVKTDSKASIRFTGLMGQNYVALDFGTAAAPQVAAGAVLETREQGDLNSLMVKLEGVASGVEGLTKSFSGESFNNLFGPVTDFLKVNNPKFAAILGNLQTISSQIAEGKGSVGKMIADEALYTSALNAVSNLDARVTQMQPMFEDAKTLVSQAKTMMAQVNQGQGTVGKLIKDEALYRETTTAMTNVREIMEKINRGQGSVGKLVNDEAFLNNAKLTLQKLDKATEGLEDQGPLSVLGIAVNNLF